jgi:hypothetical protein
MEEDMSSKLTGRVNMDRDETELNKPEIPGSRPRFWQLQ